MSGEKLSININRAKRRVWVDLPVSLSEFAEDSEFMTTAHEVCGDKAVSLSDVSSKLGALAVCHPDEVDAWREELGIAPASIRDAMEKL